MRNEGQAGQEDEATAQADSEALAEDELPERRTLGDEEDGDYLCSQRASARLPKTDTYGFLTYQQSGGAKQWKFVITSVAQLTCNKSLKSGCDSEGEDTR